MDLLIAGSLAYDTIESESARQSTPGFRPASTLTLLE